MLVPENEAYFIHEKRVTDLADLARNLNPLGLQDFQSHKTDIIKWITHSIKDNYLAERLKSAENKDHFVELLMLRQKHHEAQLKPIKDDSEKVITEHKVKKIIKKEKQNAELSEPKKFEKHYKPKKLDVEYEFNDFQHLIFEARKDLEVKEFGDALQKYEQLKELFDYSKLSKEQKLRLHAEIKYIYQELEKNI